MEEADTDLSPKTGDMYFAPSWSWTSTARSRQFRAKYEKYDFDWTSSAKIETLVDLSVRRVGVADEDGPSVSGVRLATERVDTDIYVSLAQEIYQLRVVGQLKVMRLQDGSEMRQVRPGLRVWRLDPDWNMQHCLEYSRPEDSKRLLQQGWPFAVVEEEEKPKRDWYLRRLDFDVRFDDLKSLRARATARVQNHHCLERETARITFYFVPWLTDCRDRAAFSRDDREGSSVSVHFYLILELVNPQRSQFRRVGRMYTRVDKAAKLLALSQENEESLPAEYNKETGKHLFYVI